MTRFLHLALHWALIAGRWALGFCLHPRAKQILRRREGRLGEECLLCGRWVGFQLDADRHYHLSALPDGPGRIERQAYQDARRRLATTLSDDEGQATEFDEVSTSVRGVAQHQRPAWARRAM